MATDCAICTAPIDLTVRDPDFPVAWRMIDTDGLAPWIPMERGRAQLRRCDACGTYWHLLYDLRDEIYCGGRAFPAEAAGVLRADTPVADIVAVGVAHPGARRT